MKDKVISLLDNKGKIILEKKITSLPLSEKIILSKSMEFFNDPDPCMIHRSAVMKSLYIEINDFLDKSLPKGLGQLPWKLLPDSIKAYIDIPDCVATMNVKND